MKTETHQDRLARYPLAAIGFIIRLGDRYRDVQEWLDDAADGHRDDDLVWFYGLDGAEQFLNRFPDRLIATIEPREVVIERRPALNGSVEAHLDRARRAHAARGINRVAVENNKTGTVKRTSKKAKKPTVEDAINTALEEAMWEQVLEQRGDHHD